MYVQLRMVAAVAHLYGHNVYTDQVRTVAYCCLVGNGAAELLREFGVELGKRVAIAAIKAIPGRVLIDINKKVGFRLLTKFGEKGLLNLCKIVPIVSGVVGGAMNAAGTYTIGKAAKKCFSGKQISTCQCIL